ncbi:MAG: helix-turn-helix domain-containing protein [Oscillospiraceae bacterium]|nr:helix-turn-helix domain-containing protein [Oscillospiraceae bacterium]
MRLIRQQNPNIIFHKRSTLDFALHLHNVLEIVFLRQGSATAVCGGNRYELTPGDVFVAFPNQPHGYENSRDVESDVLIIPLQPFLSPWRSMLTQKMPISPVLSRGQWEGTGLAVLMDLLRPERKTVSQPVLQGYAMVVAGKLLPLLPLTDQSAEDSDLLHALLLYISEHYHEPINRKDIAQGMGYNESYLSHVFSENLQATMMDYVNSLRLKDAKMLLLDTDLPVSDISLQLGFGSLRTFNRLFTKAENMSPREYRKRS